MRKRLFIFAAATCFALSAFATPAFAEDPVVATIDDTGYATLQDAIDNAKSGDVITLQDNLTLDNEGLRFIGSDNPTDPWKNITLNADNHSLTLNNKGIYATRCKVTITNCPELTVNAGTNPGGTDTNQENANISAVFFCPGTLTLDECNIVNITNLEPNTSGGSGLCIYNGGDLCIQNNTHFTVSGFMNGTPVNPGEEGKGGCSGIYIDSDKVVNNDYQKIMGQIVVSDNSSLTATKCYHNGITANPVDITVKNSSTIDVSNNNPGDGSGKGGLGCYYGKLTVSKNSAVKAHNNTAMQFAIYVHGFDVDGSSEIEAIDNGLLGGGYGIATDGPSILHSGAKLTAEGNCGPGVAVCYDRNFNSDPELVVEDGATLSSCRNYNYGLANDNRFTVNSGAHVILNENLFGGFDNYPYATTTVEDNADLVIKDNYGVGVNNGNNYPSQGYINDRDAIATLNIRSGLITENNKKTQMPYRGIGYIPVSSLEYGGGICNRYGDVTISSAVKIYNNAAATAGDDLYNYKNDGAAVPNDFNVTVVPGANGCVLHDGKYIDYWYKDGNGTPRWDENNAIRYPGDVENTTISIGLGEALKAAHDINAEVYELPEPLPDPKPESSPEPKPSPEPSPEPTVTPTPAPSASPAPTAAPTTAPADNTATAAPATPAPTAQPTVTATPAPTAQASGVIPQTGDSSSPALFSILTLGSITALCVLQKRHKSK